MFTGIVEELGTLCGVVDRGDSMVVQLRGTRVTADAAHGDSIAVNGCCLTVVDVHDETFTADVMKETLDRTSLGQLAVGAAVNLERAVTPQTRLGGHIVQGHVDGVGRVESRTPAEHWDVVWVSASADVVRYLAPKGSVAVDGVSLTVVDVRDGASPGFSVSLIPTTLAKTTLGSAGPGTHVNLEVDVIAKYTERLLTR